MYTPRQRLPSFMVTTAKTSRQRLPKRQGSDCLNIMAATATAKASWQRLSRRNGNDCKNVKTATAKTSWQRLPKRHGIFCQNVMASTPKLHGADCQNVTHLYVCISVVCPRAELFTLVSTQYLLDACSISIGCDQD